MIMDNDDVRYTEYIEAVTAVAVAAA